MASDQAAIAVIHRTRPSIKISKWTPEAVFAVVASVEQENLAAGAGPRLPHLG